MQNIKVCIFSLGCKTNQYESQCLANQFIEKGYHCTLNLEKADLYIINTCAVTNEAERKSRQAIQRVKSLNERAKIFVIGCASQANFNNFSDKDVTYVKGTFGKQNLINEIENRGVNIEESSLFYEPLYKPYTGNKSRVFIKIQDGCNNFCSYCIIPFLRGKSRSRLIKDVIYEAKFLEEITSEIIITGINIAAYGEDTNESIVDLINELSELKLRFRLGSLYVEMINIELLEALNNSYNFCPHFHLSLQSGSDNVLKDMNRKYLKKDYLNSIKLIREYFPHAAITTDVIVGYPTESEDDFMQTCIFLNKVKFADIHIFKYSKREGTKSAKLNELPSEIVNRRAKTLNKIKMDLKRIFLEENINSIQDVIFEEAKGSSTNFSSGYSANYIKIYADTDKKISKVKCIKLFKDGLLGETV